MELAFQSDVPAAVERAILRYRVPGMVVLAIDQDGSTHSLVRGADARGQPLTRDSIFPVASITKLATSLVVLRLVEAGKIDLDSPILSTLPDRAAAEPGVTPRRLLSHSSGLPYELDDSAGAV